MTKKKTFCKFVIDSLFADDKKKGKNMSGEIKRGDFNPENEKNQDWTSSTPIDDENQTEEKFDSTREGGEIVEEKETDQEVAVDDNKISEEKKNYEEELTPEEIKIANQEKEGIEKANIGIEEMGNWQKLEDKELLTDEGQILFSKLKNTIYQIEGKTKILFDVKNAAEVFQKRIDNGELNKVPQERFKNPKIDLKEREIEMKKLEMDYTYLKEKMRELNKEGSLAKENKEKVEKLGNEEINNDEIKVDRITKKKGFLESLKGLFGGGK